MTITFPLVSAQRLLCTPVLAPSFSFTLFSCYCVLQRTGFAGCSASEWVQSLASAEAAEKGVTGEGSFVKRQLANKTHTQPGSLLGASLRAAIRS